MSAFPISIEEVVDFLGLERDPKGRSGAGSFNVKCPLCGDPSYHMNINTRKNTYFCVRCMDGTWKNTGVLDLYCRVSHGTPLDRSDGREAFRTLMEALGKSSEPCKGVGYSAQRKERTEYAEILPAADEKLNRIYSALLSLPYLRLSEKHWEQLLDRGLTEEDIIRNGYATMPESEHALAGMEKNGELIDELRRFYADNGIADEKNRKWKLQMYSDTDVILGMKIAADIMAETGTEPDHVPGFFKVHGRWAFRSVDSGILIPTRNRYGQIVGMQTRRDIRIGSLRYMTVSSKGLEEGVTTGIARTHFPLDQQILSSTRVILTEGPLKSDVALSLMRRLGYTDVSYIALQGVKSTRELPDIAETLAESGLTEIWDGFDADKLVNLQVFRAMKAAGKILREHGNISLRPLFWDHDYAVRKETLMEELCMEHDLRWERHENVFSNIVSMAIALSSAKVGYDLISKDGILVEERWNPGTKGIDDYLLTLIRTREKTEKP